MREARRTRWWSSRLPTLSALEALLLAALLIWGFAPLVTMVIHAATSHDVFTGADGAYAIDQLEYLAWVRDAGSHLLIANDFLVGRQHAIFLHPMFVLSGAMWRLGASLPLAFQAWRPIAILILFGGTLAYVRRLIKPTAPRAAAALIALFFSAPVAALVNWTHWGAAAGQLDFRIVAGELFPASRLWGYLPSIIAAGLVPLFLLGVEAILDGSPSQRRAFVAWTSLAGCLAAWFHPWQGEGLILMIVLLCLWRGRDRGWLRLALPLGATAAPVAYYLALRHYDASWRLAGTAQLQPSIPLAVLCLCLAPIALPAIAGLRRPENTQERLLVLWTPTALAAYFVGGEASLLHLLEGLSLPLSILAVRGVSRVHAPVAMGAILTGALVAPGMVFAADQELSVVGRRAEANYIRSDEAAALRYLDRDSRPGAVLSTRYLGPAIPEYTGREVWYGLPSWTPDWRWRGLRTNALFHGQLSGARARELVRSTGARFLVGDCRSTVDLTRTVAGGVLVEPRHFGCATVYTVREGF